MLALVGLLVGGIFLLNRADAQARDTMRKHHVFDIETALFFAHGVNGIIPPYEHDSWCGSLHEDSAVRQQIEAALREQNDKYANLAKPFPTDPTGEPGYFYWKKSPSVFELYTLLEADNDGSFSTATCAGAADVTYNHGLNSALRQEVARFTL